MDPRLISHERLFRAGLIPSKELQGGRLSSISKSETNIHQLHLLLSRSRYLEFLPRCQIRHFSTMELVDGQTLAEHIGPTGLEEETSFYGWRSP